MMREVHIGHVVRVTPLNGLGEWLLGEPSNGKPLIYDKATAEKSAEGINRAPGMFASVEEYEYNKENESNA